MMTNLFSSFDPATTMKLSLNWMSTLLFMSITPMFWMNSNRNQMLMKKLWMKMHQEFEILLSNNKGFSLMFVSVFTFILMNNMMGLLPYIFTSSSHMTFSLTMALPMWLSMMIFGWTKKTNHMLKHLIPEGTPSALMPFMVCIETISNLIRPMALAVRLTANMIAGHLLMTLLGNSMMNLSMSMILIMIWVQMFMMMFELAVAMIQAYVFSILSTLYCSEVIYE